MPKFKLYFEITLHHRLPDISKFTLLLFTEKSWVNVPASSLAEESTDRVNFSLRLSQTLELANSGFLNIQLYGVGHNGLGHRRSQRLIGAASLQVSEINTSSTVPMTCQLTRSDYFQTSKHDSPATCSISSPQVKLAPFSQRLASYVAKKHEGKNGRTPSSLFVSNLYMPYYFDESLQSRLPGDFFMQFPQFKEPVGKNVWTAHIAKVVRRLFPDVKVDTKTSLEDIVNSLPESEVKLQPIHLLADVLTEVVTCYAYRPDLDESFDDVFFNLGGDCEDFAKGILKAWSELQRTAKANQNFNLFKSIYTLQEKYSAWAALGSVMKRSYSSSDSSSNKEAGHMFVVLLPKEMVAGYLNRSAQISTEMDCEGVICEGTAKVSYLAGAVTSMTEGTRTNPFSFNCANAYEMQPIKANSPTMRAFYHKVVFLFTGDRSMFNKYGNGAFLAATTRNNKFGVSVCDMLNGTNEICLLAGRSHSRELLTYFRRVYLPMQSRYMSGMTKLPLLLPLPSKKQGCHVSTKIYFVDTEDFTKNVRRDAEKAKVKCIVREDLHTYRLEF